VTSAARAIKPSAYPIRIAASVFMLHGAITMPWARKEPEEIAAAWSSHE
jgi:hypothetical protein